jgi:uncharacterized protein (TIGR01440 family)
MLPINTLLVANNIYVAIQCCEHLNRTLVVEKACLNQYGFTEVLVYPHPKGGGSLATVAMDTFLDPVIIEEIQADAGIDIGDTFIGMHLKKVVIPVRLSISAIGKAHLTAARTRPKLIGGERAIYQPNVTKLK